MIKQHRQLEATYELRSTFQLALMNINESFSLHGENLLKKVTELINEGNIRKITISDKDGKELIAFPLTVGVVGTLLAPVLAAVGALAALVGECTITVERKDIKNEGNA